MVLKFKQKVDGIPLEVEVDQLDGSIKTVKLFVATNEQSLLELMEMANTIKNETQETKEKYPALNHDVNEEDLGSMKEVVSGVTEIIKNNYDKLFGAGAYDQLSAAGLGLLKLIPLLDELTDAVGQELQSMTAENKKKSDKRKADLLIKNKNKQK